MLQAHMNALNERVPQSQAYCNDHAVNLPLCKASFLDSTKLDDIPDKLEAMEAFEISMKAFLNQFGIKDISKDRRTKDVYDAARLQETSGLTALALKGWVNLLVHHRGNPELGALINSLRNQCMDPKISPMPTALMTLVTDLEKITKAAGKSAAAVKPSSLPAGKSAGRGKSKGCASSASASSGSAVAGGVAVKGSASTSSKGLARGKGPGKGKGRAK